MHLEVQEAVGAEGHNVVTSVPSWVDAAHDAEPCWGKSGSLKVTRTPTYLIFSLDEKKIKKFGVFLHLKVDLQQ